MSSGASLWMPGRATRWVLAGLTFVLLVGVFAMHALAPHGVGTMAAHEGRVTTAAAGVPIRGHEPPMGRAMPVPRTVIAAAPDAADLVVVRSTDDRDSGQGSSLVAICVAVLVALTVCLLVVLRAAAGRRSHRRAPAGLPLAVVRRARSPDPPSLAQLSLLRC